MDSADTSTNLLPPTDDMAEIERRLAMPFVDAATTQRAVRRVLFDPVDERIVLRCIEVALEAPSGSNGQNWEFIVVTDRAIKERFRAQYRRSWSFYGGLGERFRGGDPQTARILRSVQWQVDHFADIPVLVVACLGPGSKIPFVPNPPMIASSHYGSIYPAVQNLLLAARAVGLGASLTTLPLWSHTVARRILGMPLTVEPCAMIPIGWAKGRYGPKARKPLDEVIHKNRYGGK
ncbi:MAG TPA: nitroreductase family protein [Acidimicrobiales bacterium]|jgi:nitroreductase